MDSVLVVFDQLWRWITDPVILHTYGYIGIFLTSFLGSLIVFVPVPYFLVVAAASADHMFDPTLIGVFSALGATAAKVIIFHSYDGYSTSFPIEYFTRRDIMIAYKIKEVTLPPERGFPFQLVAEDKWGYKWCKWITEIELSDNEAYLGYWESRGYSNDGSLSDCSPGPLSAQPERHPDRTDCCTCHSAP